MPGTVSGGKSLRNSIARSALGSAIPSARAVCQPADLYVPPQFSFTFGTGGSPQVMSSQRDTPKSFASQNIAFNSFVFYMMRKSMGGEGELSLS